MLPLINITYTDTEWGIPKGRRNNKESDLEVALREFEEETNVNDKIIVFYIQ